MKSRNKFIILILLALVLVACAPTQPATDLPGATATDASIADDVAEASPTAVPSATNTPEPDYPVIAPENIGQLQLLWNAEFFGDYDGDTSCDSRNRECTLYTNIAAYTFSPDGKTLAVAVCLGIRTEDRSQSDKDIWGCTAESAILLYDSATGEERGRLAPASLPMSLAFHPHGMLLAAGLANSDIELWDPASLELSGTMTGALKFFGVRSVDFTPDGELLISDSWNGYQVQLWDFRSLALVDTIDRVIGVGISPDGSSLVTLHLANEPDAIRVYDLANIENFSEIPRGEQYAPTEFSFNPINGWISSVEFGSNSYVANFWDPATSSIVATLNFLQEWETAGVQYNLSSGGFTSDGYFMLLRWGQLTTPEAQPEATGLDEPLWSCSFALADIEANQIFFAPPMLFEECTGPEYMYFDGYTPKILSPTGQFIVADDGFGNLVVWGIDTSAPAAPPECSGDC